MARTKVTARSSGSLARKTPRRTELVPSSSAAAQSTEAVAKADGSAPPTSKAIRSHRKVRLEAKKRRHRWRALTQRRRMAVRLLRKTGPMLRRAPFGRLLAHSDMQEWDTFRMQRSARDAIQCFTESITHEVLAAAVATLATVGHGQTLARKHIQHAAQSVLSGMPGHSLLFFSKFEEDCLSVV